jgi:hypothetical protein
MPEWLEWVLTMGGAGMIGFFWAGASVKKDRRFVKTVLLALPMFIVWSIGVLVVSYLFTH